MGWGFGIPHSICEYGHFPSQQLLQIQCSHYGSVTNLLSLTCLLQQHEKESLVINFW